MKCVKNCITGAISKTETVKVRIAGYDLECVKLDPIACEAGIKGGYNGERNPLRDWALAFSRQDLIFKTATVLSLSSEVYSLYIFLISISCLLHS